MEIQRLKNSRVKGKRERYKVPDEEWDPFLSLPGGQSAHQGTSGEEFLYTSEESEGSFSVELDSGEELLEEEEMIEEEDSYYEVASGDELDDVFANLNGEDEYGSRGDDPVESKGWEYEN